MAITQINLNNTNTSMQIGDMAFVSEVSANNIATDIEAIGEITEINNAGVKVDITASTYISDPNLLNGKFFSFSKNTIVNESSLKGYYADVTFSNSSSSYAELFAINSEVVPSSK